MLALDQFIKYSLIFKKYFLPTDQMGNTISLESVAMKILTEFDSFGFFGRMMKVLAAPSSCQQLKSARPYIQENETENSWYRDYIRCLTQSPHKSAYEVLAVFLLLSLILFLFGIYLFAKFKFKKIFVRVSASQSTNVTNINNVGPNTRTSAWDNYV